MSQHAYPPHMQSPDPLAFYSSNYGANLPNQNRQQQQQQPTQYQASGMAYDSANGWLAAFSATGFEGEPPLLEELGVNFTHIKDKTLTVLNPFGRIDTHIMDDTDLFGPLIFGVCFGLFLLLSGKVHFGYVYGCALLGCGTLHLVLKLMATVNTSFTRTASVLGYCLLPLVAVSAVGVALNMNAMIGYAITSAAIAWCTYSASAIFVTVLQMNDVRLLVAYPVALFYSIFAILTLFQAETIQKSN